jgi:hypothetical protein
VRCDILAYEKQAVLILVNNNTAVTGINLKFDNKYMFTAAECLETGEKYSVNGNNLSLSAGGRQVRVLRLY